MKQTNSPVKLGNGTLPINLGWSHGKHSMTIVGGQYNSYPGQPYFGVSVRAEGMLGRPVDVHLPIEDFHTPTPADKTNVEAALRDAFTAALAGRKVYVGCAGGIGRTGLFLALMAKVAGVTHPVAYVRGLYMPHAVETKAQQEYIAKFDVTELQVWLKKQARKARLRKMFGLR